MAYLSITAVTILAVALLVFVRRITVFEFERGLKYSRGKFARVLAPGQHWYLPLFTTVKKVDVRPRVVSVSGQEVLSSDGVALKVSVAAEYQVADPDVAVNQVANYQEALYLKLQLALRGIIGRAAIDDLLQKREEFGKRLMELTEAEAAKLGLKLMSAGIKDIMFPGQLKQVFTQVVKARQEGLAALERARGETAALRNLANAAKLLERNPMLMQLRVIQSVGGTSGNTLVLGMPSQTTPLPLKAAELGTSGVQEIGEGGEDAGAAE